MSNMCIYSFSASSRTSDLESSTRNVFDLKMHKMLLFPNVRTYRTDPSKRGDSKTHTWPFFFWQNSNEGEPGMICCKIGMYIGICDLVNKCHSSKWVCLWVLPLNKTVHPGWSLDFPESPPAWCELTGCQCRIEGYHVGLQALLLSN